MTIQSFSIYFYIWTLYYQRIFILTSFMLAFYIIHGDFLKECKGEQNQKIRWKQMVHRKLHLGTLGSFVSAVVAILISDREKSITSEAGPSKEYSSQVFVAIGKLIFILEKIKMWIVYRHWHWMTQNIGNTWQNGYEDPLGQLSYIYIKTI